MKKYLFMIGLHWKAQATYRLNFIAEYFLYALYTFVSMATWLALYANLPAGQHTIRGYTLTDMMVYLLLTNVSMALYSPGTVGSIGRQVQEGTLTLTLLRPYSFLGKEFADFLASNLINITTVIFILFGVLFFLGSTDPIRILLILVYMVVNMAMFFIFMNVVGLVGFLSESSWALGPVMNGLMYFIGGMAFPVSFFPEPVFRILAYTPFTLAAYGFTHAAQPTTPIHAILVQLLASALWGIFFYGLWRYCFKRALKYYEGVGS